MRATLFHAGHETRHFFRGRSRSDRAKAVCCSRRGCATENLAHAALACGLHAEGRFDITQSAIQVALAPTPAHRAPLFLAMPARQCTRGDDDGKPLCSEELALLDRAGMSNNGCMLAAVCSPFTAALGPNGQRLVLVVRLGRGPTLAPSLRRPVDAVMV